MASVSRTRSSERCSGSHRRRGTAYRVLYRRSGRLLVLLHVFGKRSGKVPHGEIRAAQRRWDDFKARMDAERRIPPRAAGHDAPG